MPTICPKCSYARKQSDTCPDWQCPECQVAYSKVGDSGYAPAIVSSPRSGFRAEPDSPTSLWKWLLVFAVLAVVAWQGRHLWKRQPVRSAGDYASQTSRQPEIILYSATWCGYCDATREFFKDNRIRFTELDIENTAEGMQGHRNLGGGGVPLIVVGDETIRGFNEAGLRRVLAPWIKG